MTLDSVRTGVRPAADRILLVGVEGIGKSTFAASAPSPVFIAAEDGVRHLDVASFPEPRTWEEVIDALRTLARERHDYRTVVIDTVDWVEPLNHAHLCERNGWASIDSPGYGKGYQAATTLFRTMLSALDHLRTARGMEVVLLAHSAIKTFANPAGDDYSRYEMKLNRGASAVIREWVDCHLFAIHEEFVTDGEGMKKAKAVSTGRRVIHTTRTAAWDAKNRHGLPPTLPLSYEDYAAARAAGRPADPAALLAEIRALLEHVDESERGPIAAAVAEHRDDAAWLARAADRLRTKAGGEG